MADKNFIPPADAIPVNNNKFIPPADAIPVNTPQQKTNVETPVVEAPKVEPKKEKAPKFVAPTTVAPVNPKTIKPSTTPAYDKRKLIQDETEVEYELEKRKNAIDKEYNNKIKNFASSSIYQDAYSGPQISGTFKLGDKTFTVGSNPQLNVMSLEQERLKKIDQVDKIAAKQKGKTVVGQRRQELLDDNMYTQQVLTDELNGLKSDRQYYSNLLTGKATELFTDKPKVTSFGGLVPSVQYAPIKPEILNLLEIKSTGNNNRDYELVQKAIKEKIAEIDADVSTANMNLGISKTDAKNLMNNVDYAQNLLPKNMSDVIFSSSQYNPQISKLEKKAKKQVGDVTSVDIPSAEESKLATSKGALMSSILNILPAGVGGTTASLLSGLYNMSKEGFFKKVSYEGLGAEKTQLLSIDAAIKTNDALNQNRLRKSYDEIYSKFNVESDKVKELALGIMKISDSMKPNQRLAPPKDMDPALFYGLIESPQFTKILNTYMGASDVFDINGKKERIALVETDKVMQLKAKEFGTIAKFQKDIEREQAFVDVMNKKSKDASILSNDFYNKLAYETAYTLTYGKATVKEMAGGAAKVGQTLYEDVLKGDVSNLTKSNIDELVYSTDLFDALIPTNSALNLGLFNQNKFIPIKDASGKNLSLEVDRKGEIVNIHAEDYAYVVRDPKQKEAIKQYYNENKEKLSLTALPLSKTEGGKRAIFDDTFRKVGKEVVQEGPTMAFEIASGGLAGLAIKGNKLRKVAQYGIAATSNMLETYPMVYKGYMENTDDPNNPYAAMLTTGGLGLVSLWTSSLDRKLIGLGERAVSKEVLPEIIENAAPVIKAISKETAKIADVNLREITFKSAVNKFLAKETLQAFKPAFKRVAAKAGEMGIETGGEVAEEIFSEPLTQFATNFFNAAIFNNQAYKQQTLDDLNFLDPETAWLTFWTAGAISTGGNIAQSIQNNNPYTQVDYLKAALKNPDKVEQMLVNISDDNSPEVIQKIREDYQALKTSYDTKKKELNVSQDLLESLDFNNPAVKIILGQAGIGANVIDNIKGSKNYDALILQQIVEEKKARDLEANIQEGVNQGLIVQTEDGYKAVGNNPLSKPYEKTIADFEKTKTNIQYFDNFVKDFNTKTAPIQRQFMDELQQSLVVAPDLYDVKNENEDESSIYYNVNAFNNLRNATLAKLVNQARLAEIETEMIGSEDKEKLQEEKATVTEAIKEAENTISTIQKQYKAGRTETNEEFNKATETAKLDQIALTTALADVSNKIDVEDISLDNHEINDIYDKYVKSMQEREKVANKLREEYGVDIPKTDIVTQEQFNTIKEQIVKRRELGKKLRTNQGTLADLRAFVGTVDTNSKIEPETSEDIDDILNDENQVLLYANELNLPNTLPYSKVKEEVSVSLHERLRQTASDNAEEALGINEILTTKIDKTTGQNTTYIIDGEEYTVANRPNSNVVTITDEQKAQVVLDELGREIARRLFSNSMNLTPETLDAIRNKVLEESYPDLDLEIDDATMELIAANIINLKLQFEAQGIEVLFNDKVISSKFTTIPESENSIIGVASKIPLIAITPEGEIHLINFKLFTGTTYSNVNTFEDEMTTIKALFEDNKVKINGIHTLPINVKMEVKDGIVTVDKTEINEVRVSNAFNQGLIPLKINIALENEILDSIEVKPIVEEEGVVEETSADIEAQKADIERRRQEELKPIEEEIKKTEKEIEELEKNNKLQGAYDFSATSNNGKWNRANDELLSLVQNNKKAFAIYKFLIGDMQTFKEIVDYLNEKGIEISYTDRMKRADETMTVEEKQSAIDSYNNSVSEKIEDRNQIEKDILSENNLQEETEYTPQELIEKYPLTGVQKIIWNLIKDIVNKLGIKVKFSSSRITEGFDGSNNPQNGEILIRPSTLKNGRFGEVLVHEVIHALTTKIISRVNSGVTTGLTQKQVNAVKGLMKLYEAIKADNNLENKYPVKDVFEFIAHLTNEVFVKELESKDKNFLEKVVDFILDILGINNANELSKKYLVDIISDGVFLEENGITVLPSDYGSKLQGSEEIKQLKDKLKKLKEQIDKINAKYDAELAALEQPISITPVEPIVEPQTPEFEGPVASSEPVEPVSKTPVYNVGGTSNGVYITVEVTSLPNKVKRYKIIIENDPDLNEYYKNKLFETLSDVKAEYTKDDVYIVNGKEVVKQPWLTPKEINTGVTYSLQDAQGNSLKSPIQSDLDNIINNLQAVSSLKGKEVTIEEIEDVNDSADVQSNFRTKSRLVVKFEGKAIAEIPSNSKIRFNLQFKKDEAGRTRLLPTTASINNIIQKDFDRTAPIPLANWYDLFEKANGKATYQVGYVTFENENYVLKTSDGLVIETFSEDKEPVLGATYLIATDANKKRTKFPLQTPKLQDIVLSDGSKITRDEIIGLINLVPTENFNEIGRELYRKVVSGLEEVIANSNNPRVKEIATLIAKELGAESTPGRAVSTEEQLKKIDKLKAYSPETTDENNNTIADFFLNRIITLTPESANKHLITTNPNTVFLDNTVQLNNLVSGDYSEEPVKLQGLSDEEFLNLVTSKGMVQINPDCL